jgi:Ca2+-binding RTX toxin-like protein
MDFPTAVVVSPDGTSVYVTSQFDDAVVRFGRDTGTGAVSYQGCITGEEETGPSGTDVCTAIGSASSFGTDSGLDNPLSLAMSSDSEFVYVAAATDDAVAIFDRDTSTGNLSYLGCATGELESGTGGGSDACGLFSSATSNGTDSGIDNPFALIVGPGGINFYVVSHDDDAMVTLERDPGSGLIVAFSACITGETESGAAGSGACTAVPSATSFGSESGLDQLYSLAASSDGNSVYAVSQGDDGVVSFGRDATGFLSYKGCISGEEDSGPMGTGACTLIPSATGGGGNSGLDKPRSLAVDGNSLYAGAPQDDSISRFGREIPATPVEPTPPGTVVTCFGISVDGKNESGTNKKDKLNGTGSSDQLKGQGGNDKVSGKGAADCLFGNADKDSLKGQAGDDVVRGGSGNDNISGGAGDDTMRAQDGDDKVKGGAGDDFIKAQARGIDDVRCGGGDDEVVGDRKDTISSSCEKVKIVNSN